MTEGREQDEITNCMPPLLWPAPIAKRPRGLGGWTNILTVMAVIGFGVASIASAGAQSAPTVIEYPDMCDASAAVAINENFFIVANDEDNVFRVYRRDQPSEPQRIPFPDFLNLKPDGGEVDIEGAARIGDVVFWIGSHGQNKNGKDRPNRHRFFATKLSIQNGKVEIKPEGAVYTNLRSDLINKPELKKYNLAAAAKLAPEASGGFNIEGLAATPDGKLLIGFRNPIRGGKSLVVPIENPKDIIQGQPARLGSLIELKLGGLGIRSLEYSDARKRYLIVAGPFDDNGKSALYTWSGVAGADPVLEPKVVLSGLNPEAMFVYPGETENVHFLSDDGGKKVGALDCKDAKVEARRFRAFAVKVP